MNRVAYILVKERLKGNENTYLRSGLSSAVARAVEIDREGFD